MGANTWSGDSWLPSWHSPTTRSRSQHAARTTSAWAAAGDSGVAWRGFCTGACTPADEVADEESDPAEDVEHTEQVAADCGSLAIGLLSAARLLLLNSMGSERASAFLPSGVVHACVRSAPSPVRGGPDRCSAAAHAGDGRQRGRRVQACHGSGVGATRGRACCWRGVRRRCRRIARRRARGVRSGVGSAGYA